MTQGTKTERMKRLSSILFAVGMLLLLISFTIMSWQKEYYLTLPPDQLSLAEQGTKSTGNMAIAISGTFEGEKSVIFAVITAAFGLCSLMFSWAIRRFLKKTARHNI